MLTILSQIDLGRRMEAPRGVNGRLKSRNDHFLHTKISAESEETSSHSNQ